MKEMHLVMLHLSDSWSLPFLHPLLEAHQARSGTSSREPRGSHFTVSFADLIDSWLWVTLFLPKQYLLSSILGTGEISLEENIFHKPSQAPSAMEEPNWPRSGLETGLSSKQTLETISVGTIESVLVMVLLHLESTCPPGGDRCRAWRHWDLRARVAWGQRHTGLQTHRFLS